MCECVSGHHFEIKEEAFMITLQDDDEPRAIHETLSYLPKMSKKSIKC